LFNVMDVAETLVNHIKANCPHDIAIIAYYGSYAQGTATKRSDLDFFFIPATSNGYGESIQFVLNNISFDFWPIGWERAERMAAFQEPNTSIIADCKILYARSDDDLARFNKLRDKIAEMPRNGLKFMERSESQLRDAYVHLYKMNHSDHSENIIFYRNEAHGVLTNVLYSLALLNRTYLTKGWGKNTEQIMNFPLKPSRLEQLMETIMNSNSCKHIREACEQLTMDTLKLLKEEKDTYSKDPSYPDKMKGFYEEIKGQLDKIKTACEMNDYSTAFFWSIGVQDEIARFTYYAEKGYWPITLDPTLDYQEYYNSCGFPDLVSFLDPQNLAPLSAAIESLDSHLGSHLRKKGVRINRFETLEQFECFLNSNNKSK
jgi:predicted nucleotidyltransferase